MKGYEIALKAIDEIVSAISEIQGCDSNDELLEDVLKNEYQTESEIKEQGYFINDK